ncbi:MAG: TIR domain-containing protein [Desulfosporosinus sp.]|nr:TIR domain-containing protein [Desulfosporosinus sp.]
MSVYFIHPKLTIGAYQLAEQFYEKCFGEIEEHIEVVSVRTEIVMNSLELGREDSIVFFNRADQLYTDLFLKLLNNVLKAGSFVFPIALTKEHRRPPELVCKSQSYDIVEELRQRCLTDFNIDTVAFALAREIIAKMQPTLCKDKMHIFLSHRREDGEEIAAVFYKEFKARSEDAFRDLIDIKVGEEAQERIESNLRKSDVVIFLDTPKTGESQWIARELEMAFALNIPIVWVRIGKPDGRVALKFNPADIPHFNLPNINIPDIGNGSTLVDNIIHKAFQISREYVKSVFDRINTIKNLLCDHQASFRKLDTRNLIFKLTIPRSKLKYRERPLVHIVQCYGRFPKDEDKGSLQPKLSKLGYEEHPEHGTFYDSTILLAPIGDDNSCYENTCITESFDDYLYYLENYLKPISTQSNGKKGIIVSGAFPDCEPEYQQNLHNALFAFANEIYQRQGIIIFGAHPTFQHLFFNLGKKLYPNNYKEYIHLYISKYFATTGIIGDLNSYAAVTATENVEEDREKSLSLMRKTMIEDNKALALICLGGKTKAGGHKPGVDEEIELARAKGLPVFIIGSVGGRSSEIAKEYEVGGWKEHLNSMSNEDNKMLMVSLDYRVMANKIFRSLGL